MHKEDFLLALQQQMMKYGVQNTKQYQEYYSEYLDDLIESGLPEEAAVAKIGSPKEVLLKIMADDDVQIPQTKNKLRSFLLILGAPVWGPLTLAFYITIAAFVFTFGICGLAFLLAGTWFLLGTIFTLIWEGLLNGLVQASLAFLLLGFGLIFEQLFIMSLNGLLTASKKGINLLTAKGAEK